MTKLTRVAGRGVRFLRTHGPRAACKAALRRLLAPRPADGKAAGGETLPYGFAYETISYRHRSAAAAPPASVNWVIPNFYGASGGHRTIFRLARSLEDAGYEVRFHVFGETHYVSDSEATEVMRNYYFPLRAAVHLGVAQMPPSEICMASSWETAYAVRDFPACRRKVYFVQDCEPSFYPASTERLLAENTYRFGFDCICAGRWLAGEMRGYGNRAESFDLAYDPSIYSPGSGDYDGNRVVFYARHQTRRRGTELGLMSLALLKRRRPETEVVIFGSDDLPYRLPFDYTPAGILGESELAELYRGAAVGLSISLTNYSLVPQEMLACGLPVVEMNLPPVRAAYPSGGTAIRLAAPEPSEVARALSEALSLPEAEARRARDAAASLVSHLSWARAGAALLDFLETGAGRRDA